MVSAEKGEARGKEKGGGGGATAAEAPAAPTGKGQKVTPLAVPMLPPYYTEEFVSGGSLKSGLGWLIRWWCLLVCNRRRPSS